MAKKNKKAAPAQTNTVGAQLWTVAALATYHEYARTKAGDVDGTTEMIIEHLGYLADTLKKGGVAIKGGGYAFTPLDGTMQLWRTSDGGDLPTDSLLGLLCHALYRDVDTLELYDCWDLDSGWLLIPAKPARRQDDFEAYTM